jgi:hypothetical protein
MKATMESTSKLVMLNGLQLRVWEGVSEKGVPFIALVNRSESMDETQKNIFIRELSSTPVKDPAPAVAGALERMGVS